MKKLISKKDIPELKKDSTDLQKQIKLFSDYLNELNKRLSKEPNKRKTINNDTGRPNPPNSNPKLRNNPRFAENGWKFSK